jgi:hypothetical protein
MMSNLIRCQPVDRGLSHLIHLMDRCYEDSFRVVEPQEPIHVRVRVRQQGGSVPEVARRRSRKPDSGQLPVGTLLDCYI